MHGEESGKSGDTGGGRGRGTTCGLLWGSSASNVNEQRDTGGPKLFPIWSTEGPKTIYKVGQLLPYDKAEYGIMY